MRSQAQLGQILTLASVALPIKAICSKKLTGSTSDLGTLAECVATLTLTLKIGNVRMKLGHGDFYPVCIFLGPNI